MGTGRGLGSKLAGIARDNRGMISTFSLVILLTLALAAVAVTQLTMTDVRVARAQSKEYRAFQAAEAGMMRTIGLLEGVPLWREGFPDPVELVSGQPEKYTVEIAETGETTAYGAPILRVTATGIVEDVTRQIEARLWLQPAKYLQAALATAGDYAGKGPLKTEFEDSEYGEYPRPADVYVKGNFSVVGTHGGSMEIEGDLIAGSHNLTPKQEDYVLGDIISPIDEEHHRPRPVYPESWYRDLARDFGLIVENPDDWTFEALVEEVELDRHPEGRIIFIDGDYALPDRDFELCGRLTVVTTGVLTINDELKYGDDCGDDDHGGHGHKGQGHKHGDDGDKGDNGDDNTSHLALIGLGGVAVMTNVREIDALIYSYEQIWRETSSGQRQQLADLSVNGAVIAREFYLTQAGGQTGAFEITVDDRLFTSPAPGIPGTTAVIESWKPVKGFHPKAP